MSSPSLYPTGLSPQSCSGLGLAPGAPELVNPHPSPYPMPFWDICLRGMSQVRCTELTWLFLPVPVPTPSSGLPLQRPMAHPGPQSCPLAPRLPSTEASLSRASLIQPSPRPSPGLPTPPLPIGHPVTGRCTGPTSPSTVPVPAHPCTRGLSRMPSACDALGLVPLGLAPLGLGELLQCPRHALGTSACVLVPQPRSARLLVACSRSHADALYLSFIHLFGELQTECFCPPPRS